MSSTTTNKDVARIRVGRYGTGIVASSVIPIEARATQGERQSGSSGGTENLRDDWILNGYRLRAVSGESGS